MAKPDSIGFRLRGVAGIVAMIPVAAVALCSARSVLTTPGLHLAADIAAWAFFLTGISFRLASIVFVGGRKGKSLVTNGPYAACRNPLYFGSLMIAMSGALFLHSLTLLAGIVLAGLFYVLVVIPSEEKQLEAAFPDAWKAYVASTPRFLPLRRWKVEGQWHEIDLRALRNESLRVLGMGSVPLVVQVLLFLSARSWWPATGWTLP